jgi:uncharacterized protein YbjT (DUF2867 family)
MPVNLVLAMVRSVSESIVLERNPLMPQKKVIVVVGATGAQGGGVVRAILADKAGPFAARAVTRRPGADQAKALTALGAEVVAGDTDDPASLEKAFAGAYGAYCVTSFLEHSSPEREIRQATAMARASRKAGLQHVVWSTLEDTRKWIPLSDDRLPTLRGQYKLPHFDAKGEMDAFFAAEAAPTSYLLAAFYLENFISFGSGPRRQPSGVGGKRVAPDRENDWRTIGRKLTRRTDRDFMAEQADAGDVVWAETREYVALVRSSGRLLSILPETSSITISRARNKNATQSCRWRFLSAVSTLPCGLNSNAPSGPGASAGQTVFGARVTLPRPHRCGGAYR